MKISNEKLLCREHREGVSVGGGKEPASSWRGGRALGMQKALGWEVDVEGRCWAGSHGAGGNASVELGSPKLCV